MSHNTPSHKKRKKKSVRPKTAVAVFWRAQARLEVSGDFWIFFLPPDTHSACPFFERGGTATCLHCGRQLWSAAGGPAGTAERATCSGEFVWKPAGWASALIRGRTEPSTADRHDTPTLSLTVTLSSPPATFYISFSLPSFSPPSFAPHAHPSSLQGSEITL